MEWISKYLYEIVFIVIIIVFIVTSFIQSSDPLSMKDKKLDIVEIKHDPYVRRILTLCFILLLIICFKLYFPNGLSN